MSEVHFSILFCLILPLFAKDIFPTSSDALMGLAMEWPQGTCAQLNLLNDTRHKCVVSDDIPSWIVHRLARVKNVDCPVSKGDFNEQKVRDMEGSLLKYWPPLPSNYDKVAFWKFLYHLHGLCLKSVKGLETTEKYFWKALELRSKYDPLQVLHRAGILPRKAAHDMDQIRHAFAAGYDGKRICVHCGHTGHDERTLSWIEICMKEDFSLTDCPEHYCHGYGMELECQGHMLYQPLPGMITRLSTGSVVLMLVLPSVLLYFVLVALYNRSIGQEGANIIPHREILQELPELILDGFMYTASRFTCNSTDSTEPRTHEETIVS